MNYRDAYANLQAHLSKPPVCDRCSTVPPGAGVEGLCPEGRRLYVSYLVAGAEMLGIDPQSIEGVRADMRLRGLEPRAL